VNEGWSLDADTPDDESLARLESHVAALQDARCVDCLRGLCGHESLFNVAMGLTTKPRCLSCLAVGLATTATELRNQLFAHFQHRACYGEVWRRVNEREGFPRQGLPACLWPDSGGERADVEYDRGFDAPASSSQSQADIPVADDWDAGEMACGDLVLALRLRLDRLSSRATLRLVARDPGAKEDLPAWCRLTGHKLLAQSHPEYWIQRKE
jgi:tRNA 2-thiouridine synthesizing protein A